MLFALHSTDNSFLTLELLLGTLALTHSGRELRPMELASRKGIHVLSKRALIITSCFDVNVG